MSAPSLVTFGFRMRSQLLQRIIREVDASPVERLTFLCKHLRGSAQNVGARKVVDAANVLCEACEHHEYAFARTVATSCANTLHYYSLQLQRCY